MALRSVRFGVRSRKLSNVGQSLDEIPKNLLSRVPLCFETFERHVKLLVPAAFAVVSTHQPTLDLHDGLWPVFVMCKPIMNN
jgi:hypothetical protein